MNSSQRSEGQRIVEHVRTAINARGVVTPCDLAACLQLRLELYAGSPLSRADDDHPGDAGYLGQTPHCDERAPASSRDRILVIACVRYILTQVGRDPSRSAELIEYLARELCGVDVSAAAYERTALAMTRPRAAAVMWMTAASGAKAQ